MNISIDLDQTINELSSEDFDERNKAIEVLSSIHQKDIYLKISELLALDNAIPRNAAITIMTSWGPKVTPILVERLKNSSENQRLYACNALGDIKDPKAVDALLTLLTDPDNNVRFAAAEAIGKIQSKDATIPLLHYLHSMNEDPWEQFPLILTLGELRDERAVVPLLRLAENEMLKQPILQAITQIGDEHALPYIIEVLKIEDASLQLMAILAIKKIKEKTEKYQIGEDSLKLYIQTEFEKFKSRELYQVINNLKDFLNQEDYNVKLGSIFLLGLTDNPEALNILISSYSSDLLPEIEDSIFSLAKNNASTLIQNLAREEIQCREVIIRILGKLKVESAYNTILVDISNPLPDVRTEVAFALGEMNNTESINNLITLLADPSYDVQNQAIISLQKFDREVVLPKLTEKLNNNPDEFELIFTKIVFELKPSIDISEVIKFAESANFMVRKTVAESLKNYHQEESFQKLVSFLKDSHSHVREEAIMSLESFGDSVIVHLLNVLNDESPWVRYYAAKALSSRKNNSLVIENISKLIDDEVPFVKISAINALGNLQANDIAERLLEFVSSLDIDISIASIISLSNLELNEAQNEAFYLLLEKQIENKNWSVRKATAKALGKLITNNSLELLLRMLAQENESIVDNQIIESLGNLYVFEEVTQLLISFTRIEEFRNISLEVLSNLGKSIIPNIQKELENDDSEIRINIVSILSKIKDEKSLLLLVKLASVDPSPSVRKHTILALHSFNNEQKAVWAIMWAANHDSDELVRKTAKSLLIHQ